MVRVGIYARVSSEDQRDNTSIETQIADCRAYAERHGWTVYDQYVDEAQSGRKERRPQLTRLRADVASGRITAVLVWKLDRLARNARLQLQLLEEFQHIIFNSVTEPLEFATSGGKFTATLLAGAAQFYSDRLGEGIKRALLHTAQQGRWVGPVPLGYQRGDTGVLEPTDDAAVVQRIFALYASGTHSYTSIADNLNALGHRALDWRTGARRLFGRESIRTILRNRAYCGYVTSGGDEYSGAHELLVSEEAFQLCAEVRGERHSSHHSPTVQTPALLIQRAMCAICGAKIWIHRSGGQGRPAWFYRCSGNSRRTCDAPMVDIRTIDRQMLAELRALTIPPEWVADVTAQAEQLLRQTAPVVTVDRAAIEQQMKRYALIFAEGVISEEEYRKKKTYLTGLLAQAAANPAVERPRLDRAAELLASLGATVELANLDERRMIIRAIFTTVWIAEKRLKAVTPTDAFLHLIEVTNGVRVADGFQSPTLHLWLGLGVLYH